MNESELYAGREQTLVKHFILEHYLERFAYIVGTKWDTLTYIDCFSGPWNVQSDRLQDSSFYIALNRLRRATSDLGSRGRTVNLRCLFLEKSPSAYQQLRQFTDTVSYAEVETINSVLETAIDDICRFVERGGNSSFPFFFVDPTGWTGFAMDLIQPLLEFKPGEVLVNFMTGHILRFADSPDLAIRQSFDRLFGPIDYGTRIAGSTGRDREDKLVGCYSDALRLTGKYKYVCPAIVIHPQKDRTHYHLLYATRSSTGVKVFKQVEKKAMELMEKARGDAQSRKRMKDTAQGELFDPDAMHSTQYYDALRMRHLTKAEADIEERLRSRGTMEYDDAWDAALSHPLVWESDLKAWIANWCNEEKLKLGGLKLRERVPKRGEGHQLVWLS